MKSRKQMLKFFLEQLGLWEKFEQDLESHQNLPSWDEIDDDLDITWIFESEEVISDETVCVANKLFDKLYLAKLMNINEFVQYAYDEALAALFEYAGLTREDPQVMKSIPDRASVIEIIDYVYISARSKGV